MCACVHELGNNYPKHVPQKITFFIAMITLKDQPPSPITCHKRYDKDMPPMCAYDNFYAALELQPTDSSLLTGEVLGRQRRVEEIKDIIFRLAAETEVPLIKLIIPTKTVLNYCASQLHT